jgi:hypothetical protein
MRLALRGYGLSPEFYQGMGFRAARSARSKPEICLYFPLDLRRFRGLFKTENSARKGEQCHEHAWPTRQTTQKKTRRLCLILEIGLDKPIVESRRADSNR